MKTSHFIPCEDQVRQVNELSLATGNKDWLPKAYCKIRQDIFNFK